MDGKEALVKALENARAKAGVRKVATQLTTSLKEDESPSALDFAIDDLFEVMQSGDKEKFKEVLRSVLNIAVSEEDETKFIS